MTDPMRRLARLAMLLALATVLHTAEALLPVTVVWFRFGFANIVGLAALYLFGFRDALALTLGRVLLGSLAIGQFGSPGFVLSLSGGVSAIVMMALCRRMTGALFSEVGISVIGAVSHNLGQLIAAGVILIRNEGILLLAPVLLLASIGTGFINGLATRFLVERFKAALPQ